MKKTNRLKPLGPVQASFLRSMPVHKFWRPYCGWDWGSLSETQKIVDSLVRRGNLVQREDGAYVLSDMTGPGK